MSQRGNPLRATIDMFAVPSTCQICFRQNGIGDLTHSFCFHSSGIRTDILVITPHSKYTKLMQISIGLLNNAHKNQLLKECT